MYNKSVEYIYSLERTDKEFNLEAISKFLEKIGNPHHKLKCIHVAGTNGKGSTCAFINQGLIDSGFKVGFFSSPHLVKFNERIRVNNELISDEELDRLVEKLDRLQKETGVNLTFFEGATVLAYLHFLEKEVDYVVLETGLGGRLDATTTCKPVMCVITSIGMDHMHMLGDTIEKIAFEKAGIIKKGVKVITSAKGKALEVIGEECWKKNCSVISIMEMDFFDNYQNENASLAYKVLFELNLDEEIIRKAILKTKWKGRMEMLEGMLLDCAHNVDGVRKLVDAVKGKKIILVFGVCQNKKVKEMSDILKKMDLVKVIVTQSKVDKAMDKEELAKFFPGCVIKENVKEAIDCAKQFEGLVLVCGSIYLVGEIYH